jgi:hypothetical protein
MANYFSPVKDKPLPDKDTLWRKFTHDLSSQERLKLEGIIFYQTVGKRNAILTALYFGISRKTFHKRKRKKEKTLITNFSSLDQFNLLWHIDSLIISWSGLRRTIITAIEEVTKIAYTRNLADPFFCLMLKTS